VFGDELQNMCVVGMSLALLWSRIDDDRLELAGIIIVV
jgi:hypothetical protein